MERFSGLEKLNRITKIIDLISRGFTGDDVNVFMGLQNNLEIGEHRRSEKKWNELDRNRIKGRESERYIRELLWTLPFVNRVINLSGTVADVEYKKDLKVELDAKKSKVFLNAQLMLPNDCLWVQVKSSDFYMEKFKTELGSAHNLTGEEVKQWLLENRLILINASKTPFEIMQEFQGQLIAINNFWVQKFFPRKT